jgi:hypothetical protein
VAPQSGESHDRWQRRVEREGYVFLLRRQFLVRADYPRTGQSFEGVALNVMGHKDGRVTVWVSGRVVAASGRTISLPAYSEDYGWWSEFREAYTPFDGSELPQEQPQPGRQP